MYRDKHEAWRSEKTARKGRLNATIISVVLILTLAVGGTIAFLSTKTDPVVNTFNPSQVTCSVVEDFDGKTKTNVNVKNTGDIPAYIRARIVVTWKDASGNVSAVPVKNTDYTIAFNETDWTQQGDYWYCKTAVDAGGETPVLIIKCEKKGNAPKDYDLSVEILADAIQSEPASAVTEAWGYTPTAASGK